MTSLRRQALAWIIVAFCVVSAGQALAQPGPPFGRGGRGPGGPGQDPQFVADRDLFHFLLGNHDQVRRKVTPRADGVETLTESDNPEIAAKIQEHVAAMYRRVDQGRPIHLRDPLFAEVFRHADQIELKFEKTENGVKVVETSKDPYVAKLIQAHADVVNLFVKNGFAEPPKNHAVPAAATATAGKPADEPNFVAAGPCGKCPACCAQQANAACKACPKAAASDPACKACPNAATCPAGKACPAAGQANAACKTCPKAAASNPACKACPNAANCPAGKACPAAGQANAACKTCPKAAASNPACKACPNAPNCPAGQGNAVCKACPQAANCPGGASCPLAKAEDDAPPPPNQGAKSKPGSAKSKGNPKS